MRQVQNANANRCADLRNSNKKLGVFAKRPLSLPLVMSGEINFN